MFLWNSGLHLTSYIGNQCAVGTPLQSLQGPAVFGHSSLPELLVFLVAGHIFQYHCWYRPISFPLWPCTSLCLEFSSSLFHRTSTFLSSKSVLMAFLSPIILPLFLLPTPPSLIFLIFMAIFDSFLFYLASLHFSRIWVLIQIALESKFTMAGTVSFLFVCLFWRILYMSLYLSCFLPLQCPENCVLIEWVSCCVGIPEIPCW